MTATSILLRLAHAAALGCAILPVACGRRDYEAAPAAARLPVRSRLAGPDTTRANAARGLLRRFLAADTAGNPGAAAAFVSASDGLNPFCELGGDLSFVVQSFDISQLEPRGDTVRLAVRFRVAGVIDDRGRSGVRFRDSDSSHVDTVRVAPDSSGVLRIACGDLAPNHVPLSTVERAAVRMDSASLDRWRRARRRH